MDDIRVTKAVLLARLKENRASHRDTYVNAREIFRQRSADLAQEQAELMLRGEIRAIAVNLPVPEDHTDDYDRVIEMLDWHLDDEFILSEIDFQQYVRDEWGWARSFAANTSSYLAS